ncbi:hypothetical protein H2198_004033 [Neophaeococcomyces mojaviensis]|uniref:Uncharacterized protein n=1 Tax=Neophaeococcomyces mojaviensis TaxID=3383035 RepID=A0ACC3A9M4_9EURO|nr:hypothetical protein H2198_004033 [Knufia sp. JES_112]
MALWYALHYRSKGQYKDFDPSPLFIWFWAKCLGAEDSKAHGWSKEGETIAEGYPEIFGMHIHQKKVKNDGGKDEWNDEWNPFKPEFYDKEGDRLGLKKPPAPPEKLEGE